MYAYTNQSQLAVFRTNLDSTNGFRDRFELHNQDYYSNLTWTDRLNDKWRIFTGGSFSTDQNKIKLNSDTIGTQDQFAQGKIVLTRYVGTLSTIRFGGEFISSTGEKSFNQFKQNLDDNFSAGFVETDIYFTTKLVARLGTRVESSQLLGNTNIAPRVSIAYKLAEYTTASLAYGDFYQKPQEDFLYGYSTHPGFEKATHYIVNLQRVTPVSTFRAEAYEKTYDDLLKFHDDGTQTDTFNDGYGFARGVDIFWRNKSFKTIDYWISYSWLKTERNYLNYPKSATPPFAASNTVSFVYKQFIPKIMTSFGITYTFATGRTYFDPSDLLENFLSHKTDNYNLFGANASYLTKIGGAFTVIVFGVNNVFATKNIFSYRFSTDGTRSEPVVASSDRSFFIGVFMSFGVDRRKEVVDNQ